MAVDPARRSHGLGAHAPRRGASLGRSPAGRPRSGRTPATRRWRSTGATASRCSATASSIRPRRSPTTASAAAADHHFPFRCLGTHRQGEANWRSPCPPIREQTTTAGGRPSCAGSPTGSTTPRLLTLHEWAGGDTWMSPTGRGAALAAVDRPAARPRRRPIELRYQALVARAVRPRRSTPPPQRPQRACDVGSSVGPEARRRQPLRDMPSSHVGPAGSKVFSDRFGPRPQRAVTSGRALGRRPGGASRSETCRASRRSGGPEGLQRLLRPPTAAPSDVGSSVGPEARRRQPQRDMPSGARPLRGQKTPAGPSPSMSARPSSHARRTCGGACKAASGNPVIPIGRRALHRISIATRSART